MKTMQGIGLGLLLTFAAMNLRAEDAMQPENNNNNNPASAGAREPRHLAELREGTDPAWAVGTFVDYRRPLNGDFDHLSGLMVVGEANLARYHAVDFFVGGGGFNATPGTDASLDTIGRGRLEVGGAMKQYLTPPNVFLRPYFTEGVSALYATWDYKNPGPGEHDGDSMAGGNGYVGVGLYAGSQHRWRFFAEVDAGAMAFEGRTDQGFRNTLFQDFGYVGGKAGLALSF
jgi:hypothetical protein